MSVAVHLTDSPTSSKLWLPTSSRVNLLLLNNMKRLYSRHFWPILQLQKSPVLMLLLWFLGCHVSSATNPPEPRNPKNHPGDAMRHDQKIHQAAAWPSQAKMPAPICRCMNMVSISSGGAGLLRGYGLSEHQSWIFRGNNGGGRHQYHCTSYYMMGNIWKYMVCWKIDRWFSHETSIEKGDSVPRLITGRYAKWQVTRGKMWKVIWTNFGL